MKKAGCYFDKPDQSSSVLSIFRNSGDLSPGHVLEYERLQEAGLFWSPPMEMGNAMEAKLQDKSTGSKLFDASFFISDVDKISFSETDGKRSHASEILWTAKHWKGDVNERLLELIEGRTKTDKNGNKSDHANAVNANALARECIANPGRLPITQKDYHGIKTLANKIIEMPLPALWWRGIDDWTVGDFLCHQDATWQEEIYWDAGEIKKKAKTDVLLVHGKTAGIIDLKWTGSLPIFKKRLRDKWIQAVHYEEAVRVKYEVTVLPMLYVVASAGTAKGEPPLVTAITIDDGDCTRRDRCFCAPCRRAEYERTSMAYHQWEVGGRGHTGFLEAGKVKVWV